MLNEGKWMPVLFVAVLFAVPGIATAQFSGALETADIVLTPTYPGAEERVEAQVRAAGNDMRAAEIVWILNDEVYAEGVGLNRTTFTTGAIGETDTLEVLARTAQGAVLTDTVVIQPAAVALLWEADTYTPPFYHGRSLYTSGAQVRAKASVEARDNEGVLYNPEELVYTWYRDTTVLQNASGRGREEVVVSVSPFVDTYILSVEVATANRIPLGIAATRIQAREPQLSLYEEDPLIGTAYHRALNAAHAFSGTAQTQLRAEPLFFSAENTNSPALVYDWRIQGTAVEGGVDDPALLTIQLAGDEDAATQTTLSVSHELHLLQQVARTWSFVFEASARDSLFGF